MPCHGNYYAFGETLTLHDVGPPSPTVVGDDPLVDVRVLNLSQFMEGKKPARRSLFPDKAPQKPSTLPPHPPTLHPQRRIDPNQSPTGAGVGHRSWAARHDRTLLDSRRVALTCATPPRELAEHGLIVCSRHGQTVARQVARGKTAHVNPHSCRHRASGTPH